MENTVTSTGSGRSKVSTQRVVSARPVGAVDGVDTCTPGAGLWRDWRAERQAERSRRRERAPRRPPAAAQPYVRTYMSTYM